MATINNHDTQSFHNEKQTVLIVDDSKVIRLALNKILKNDFVVIQANDGEDAWDKLQDNDAIAAIFSDVSMPNLDGFGLLDRVRTSSETRVSTLPFIIITANDDDPDFSTKVANAGGNDLITKPFKTDEIKACIQNHINVEQVQAAEPSLETPAIPDQEVAEILGIEGVEAVDNIDTSSPAQADNGMEFSIDENFFETDTDTMAAEEIHEQAVTPAPDSADLSHIANIDFGLDEGLFNETLETTAEDSASSSADDFEFTIDEEFLNNNLESEHHEADSAADSHVNNIPDMSASAVNESADQPEKTPAPTTPAMALSLEAEIDADKASQAEKADKLVIKNLEQARRHATEVAQEKTQPEQKIVRNSAQQSTEREQIRARLQQIREQEKHDLANARKARGRSKGNSASLLSKLGRIISKLFGFRKK